jgi:hypothetical protein
MKSLLHLCPDPLDARIVSAVVVENQHHKRGRKN